MLSSQKEPEGDMGNMWETGIVLTWVLKIPLLYFFRKVGFGAGDVIIVLGLSKASLEKYCFITKLLFFFS